MASPDAVSYAHWQRWPDTTAARLPARPKIDRTGVIRFTSTMSFQDRASTRESLLAMRFIGWWQRA
ncbi:hypothetical protein CFB47_38250 [Burkholderia sp. AU27893]|nr:hypothetical protein WK32_03615 [Burkholderia vietnamiensis]KVS35723.1 hypothetical protein WK35_03855 [Burkholderia vietnamiensis]MBB0074563.1 hypothetical protein [Burkholderia cepacia]OXI51759.1 hypothetical protein CFB47_38250 [Burkholderia sp. AU27893]